MISRRRFLHLTGVAALGAVAAACKGGNGGNGGTAQTLADVVDGRPQEIRLGWTGLDVLARPGDRLTFTLQDGRTGQPVVGAGGRVWLGEEQRSAAVGPFDLRPIGNLESRGVYIAHVDIPREGTWQAIAEVSTGSEDRLAAGQVPVGPRSVQPKPGEQAVSVATPTKRNNRGVDPYCSGLVEEGSRRRRPCRLHDVSLDAALDSSKPTVLIIATPAFCQTDLCGPEVEYVEEVATETGDAANFIHIEVYRDDDPETIRNHRLSPAAAAWRLSTEPVIYFIDTDGMIRDRTLGPIDVKEVRDATRALVG